MAGAGVCVPGVTPCWAHLGCERVACEPAAVELLWPEGAGQRHVSRSASFVRGLMSKKRLVKKQNTPLLLQEKQNQFNGQN